MTIVAHAHSFVIGVDTHARNHVLAILAATGEIIDTGQFPTTAAGLARAIAWVGRRTGGDLAALWIIEGIASYGAGLAATVARAGYEVIEAARMNARGNRGLGKSDPLDAHRIAAAVLALDTRQLRRPRLAEGTRATLRVLIASRDHMTAERTATINALIALLRVVELGIDARLPLSRTQPATVARWRSRDEDLGAATAQAEATRLARRVIELDEQIAANSARMSELVHASQAAPLLEKRGIGPTTAAICLTAWSHHGRVRSEAAFAALAGANPTPASSGNTVRHRLM